MTIKRITVDTAALPAALLDLVKSQARVEYTRDDALITGHIAGAVGIAERKCNVSLDPAEYVVTADELRCSPLPYGGATRQSWRLPLNNVREVTVMASADVDADDLSADYEVWAPDPGGSASAYLVAVNGRAVPPAALLSLTVGVTTLPDLAPAFVSLIARLAASMYENREASSALWVDAFAGELASLWRAEA